VSNRNKGNNLSYNIKLTGNRIEILSLLPITFTR